MSTRWVGQTKPVSVASQVPARTGVLQRKCACGGVAGPTGECATCRRKRQPGGVLQTKLRINQPGDPFELEADRVAEQVMRMPAPGLQRQAEEEEELLQTKSPAQRQVTSGAGGNEAPPIVHDVLRSPGRPLDPATRTFMESRFGHDFSQVRVHTDARAAESTKVVNALAYTMSRDVVFGARQYAPETLKGKRLLAHELTHVVQQASGLASGPARIAETNTSNEREANQAADGVSRSNRMIRPQLHAPVQIARNGNGPAVTPNEVEVVQISCASNTIDFYTNAGLFSYQLTACDLTDGDYNASVTVMGDDVRFDLGEAAPEGLRFSFSYRVDPGQPNPATFFQNQTSVRIVASTGPARVPVNPEIANLPWGRHVDNFESVVYDLDYRSEGGNLSTWLRVIYSDGTEIDISIYDITDESMSGDAVRDALARGHIGDGGRIFPEHMNPQTTPRLSAAKQSAIEAMEEFNVQFIMATVPAVTFIITMPLAVMGAGRPQAVRRPALRRLTRITGGVAGFTAQESAVISEVRQILSSSEMAQVRAAHAAGESVTVRIGGRLIQYEPGLPASGMTMFGENGFIIGREAFASEAELTKTLLHELYRLSTSAVGRGASASGTAVSAETQAAFQFAERAYNAVFR